MSDTKASPGPWYWEGDEFVLTLFDAERCPVGVQSLGPAPNDMLRPDDASLIALSPTMASMLLELEWAGGEAVSRCPVCGERPEHKRYVSGVEVPGKPGFVFNTAKRETVPGGHAHDCALAAILSELRRP